jgi:WD40 repeat protein
MYHDLIEIVDDKYLVCGGMDDRIRVFNIDTEKLIVKFEPHLSCSHICLLQVSEDVLFSYSNNELVKWSYL